MKRFAACLCCLVFRSVAGGQQPVFSEDFESGQIDLKAWEQRTQGTAALSVQADQAAHGTYALKIHYPALAVQSYAFLVAAHLPDSVRSHYYGRASIKIDPATPPNHTVLIFGGGPAWPLSKFEEIGVYKGTLQPSYQENKSARGQGRGEDVRHGEAVPVGKWFLLEWECNDDPSTLTVWIDGQPSGEPFAFHWPKGSGTAKGLVGGFVEFGFGTRVWGPALPAAFDVYYDDIAIGTTRVGPVR